MVKRAKRFVGRAAGDTEKIPPKLLFVVRRGDVVGGRSMHVADIARVAAIAAAKIFRRAFEHEHLRPCAPRRDRRAQRRIAAADDENVIRTLWIWHREQTFTAKARRTRMSLGGQYLNLLNFVLL